MNRGQPVGVALDGAEFAIATVSPRSLSKPHRPRPRYSSLPTHDACRLEQRSARRLHPGGCASPNVAAEPMTDAELGLGRERNRVVSIIACERKHLHIEPGNITISQDSVGFDVETFPVIIPCMIVVELEDFTGPIPITVQFVDSTDQVVVEVAAPAPPTEFQPKYLRIIEASVFIERPGEYFIRAVTPFGTFCRWPFTIGMRSRLN